MSKKRQIQSTPTFVLNKKSDVSKIASIAKLAINIIKFILATIFIFLSLNYETAKSAINFISPKIIYETAFLIYYIGWIFGASFDIWIQESANIEDPDQGSLNKKEISSIIFFTIIMAALFYSHRYELYFPIVLFLFVTTNMFIVYKIVNIRMKKIINKSRAIYGDHEDYFGLEKISTSSEYQFGKWQLYRFRSMLISCIAIQIVVILIQFTKISIYTNKYQLFGIELSNFINLVPSVMFLMFVLIFEGWIYFYRLKAYIQMQAIERFSKSYIIRKL